MEAKIPKVNEQNEVVGETTITEAKANGWMRRIVRVFVFSTDGKLLLQRRSPNVIAFPNLWDQSAGGHVDIGEDPETAARRETREELGITVSLEEVVNYHRSDDPADKVFSYVYRATITPDTSIDFDTHEVAEVKWYTVTEFEQAVHDTPEAFTPTFVSIWFANRDKLIPT